MYYKIISNGEVVDACDGLSYVRWQERNRLFLSCGEEDADGILSSDGADIYLLPGALAVEGCARVTVTEITEEEYTALRDELDAGRTVIEPDEELTPNQRCTNKADARESTCSYHRHHSQAGASSSEGSKGRYS